MNGTAQVVPVQVTLWAHPPAPARVGLVPQPLPGRAVKALLSLAFFWGVIPYAVWVPPHYPWPVACLCAGAFLAHTFWTGRYRVLWFMGVCPRCGKHLRIASGTRIQLPHTLTCFACHFEPVLRVQEPEQARPEVLLRHLRAECTGTWSEGWMWDERFLACGGCGARQPATPELRRLADGENEHGSLLRQLADEGRFLG
jgi:hypothetical protein